MGIYVNGLDSYCSTGNAKAYSFSGLAVVGVVFGNCLARAIESHSGLALKQAPVVKEDVTRPARRKRAASEEKRNWKRKETWLSKRRLVSRAMAPILQQRRRWRVLLIPEWPTMSTSKYCFARFARFFLLLIGLRPAAGMNCVAHSHPKHLRVAVHRSLHPGRRRRGGSKRAEALTGRI
jgi:hypothetical protein